MCESVAECMYVHANVCVRDNSNVKRSVCMGFNVAAKSKHCNRSAVRLTEMSYSPYSRLVPKHSKFHACIGDVFVLI